MVSRRLFLKAAGMLLGAAALPRPVASAAAIPATLPGGTMRFLDAAGSYVVEVPLTLERLPGAIGFSGRAASTACAMIDSCVWTLPDGTAIPATVGDLYQDADIRLSSLHFATGGILHMDVMITFDGPSDMSNRFFALECYRSLLGLEGPP
jgi:hypothetical protein